MIIFLSLSLYIFVYIMDLMNQFPTDLQQLVRYHPVDVSKTFVNGGLPGCLKFVISK